jgi:DNA-directed RNA polymerase subunit RPC12/RpoP
MKLITCPHCGHRHVVASRVPKDVVVVMPCPACSDLVIMFRNKVVGLKRKIVEEGSFEEKKTHISEVIAHFLEPGMIWPDGVLTGEPGGDQDALDAASLAEWMEGEDEEAAADPSRAVDGGSPITQGEVDHFVTIDLQRIDDPSYFRKYFS